MITIKLSENAPFCHGWHTLERLDLCKHGDAIVFIRKNGDCLHPSNVSPSAAWSSIYGLICGPFTCQTAGELEKIPCEDLKLGWTFAVYRKVGVEPVKKKRSYIPSKWSEPVPLP